MNCFINTQDVATGATLNIVTDRTMAGASLANGQLEVRVTGGGCAESLSSLFSCLITPKRSSFLLPTPLACHPTPRSPQIMVQRRIQRDDGRGVGEPLNETGLDVSVRL